MGASTDTTKAKLTRQKIHDVIYDVLENYLAENDLMDTLLSSSELRIRLDGDDWDFLVTIAIKK